MTWQISKYFFEACDDWPQILRLSMSVSQFASILLHLILSLCDNMEMRQVSMEESLPMHACTCFFNLFFGRFSCRGPNCCLYPISIWTPLIDHVVLITFASLRLQIEEPFPRLPAYHAHTSLSDPMYVWLKCLWSLCYWLHEPQCIL